MAKGMSNGGSRCEVRIVDNVLLDDPELLRGIAERSLQQILEAEMTAHMRAERYERGEQQRRGHRNSYKPRELRTRVGRI